LSSQYAGRTLSTVLIGERLRELRESKNLSQGDIENRTGLLCCYTEVGALRRRIGDASVRKIFGLFGGIRVDQMVAMEVIGRLQPLGVEAALAAIEACRQERSEKKRQLEFALQQARYEAARARRQYDVVDPENRLVAGELERRWNEHLATVRTLEQESDRLAIVDDHALTEANQEHLMMLGQDLARAWDSCV